MNAKKMHFSQAIRLAFEELLYVIFKTASNIYYILKINEKFNFNFPAVIFFVYIYIYYTLIYLFFIHVYISIFSRKSICRLFLQSSVLLGMTRNRCQVLSLLPEFASNIHPSIGHRLKVKNYPIYFASKLPCSEIILHAVRICAAN